MRAAIYARVSTVDQEPENQLADRMVSSVAVGREARIKRQQRVTRQPKGPRDTRDRQESRDPHGLNQPQFNIEAPRVVRPERRFYATALRRCCWTDGDDVDPRGPKPLRECAEERHEFNDQISPYLIDLAQGIRHIVEAYLRIQQHELRAQAARVP